MHRKKKCTHTLKDTLSKGPAMLQTISAKSKEYHTSKPSAAFQQQRPPSLFLFLFLLCSICLSLCPVSPSLCYLMVQPAGTDFSVQTEDSLTSLRGLLHTQTWLEGLWVVLRWLSLSSVTAPLQSFGEVRRSRAEGWGPGSCCSGARCRSQRIWRVRKRGWGVVAG